MVLLGLVLILSKILRWELQSDLPMTGHDPQCDF